MRVVHVNAFDTGGGAARAAMRLHEGLLKFGVDSHFVTVKPTSENDTVTSPLGKWQTLAAIANRHAASKLVSLQKTATNRVVHSLGQFSSGLGDWVEKSDFDIVNLHWICAEALSIQEIARISKPIVWTMHDMWPFMGAEHYDDLDYPGRWKENYTAANRPPTYRGPDLDRYVWRKKTKLWAGKKFRLVAPSRWLARCANDSALMGSQRCEVIPNPIDTESFEPIEKEQARRILRLPIDRNLILFGALGATSDPRKGFDLLIAALHRFERDYCVGHDTELVVLGGREMGGIPNIRMKTHFLGTLHDDLSLRVVYSAADILVAPSRQDNLPNVVVEAGACGLPTVAFDIGGMSDIIVEGMTGLTSKPFEPEGLAASIYRMLASPIARETVRTETQRKFSLEATVPAYKALYRDILGQT